MSQYRRRFVLDEIKKFKSDKIQKCKKKKFYNFKRSKTVLNILNKKFKVTINQSIINIDEADFFNVIEESDVIERDFHAYFDLTIVNEDMGRCFTNLVEAIDALRAEPQWVPVTWLY